MGVSPAEALVQSPGDLFYGEKAHPGRRQFDGEWHAIQLMAYLSNRRSIGIGDEEAHQRMRCAAGKKLNGIVL